MEGGPVVLAECTLEKPLQKFSALADRAKQLAEHIGGQAEVLGVVFTRADTVDSEKEQARQHGLVVGHNELLQLLKLRESGAGTRESIGYLRELQSNLVMELGALLDARWPSRW